jgi:hypothetical protein
MYNIMNKLVIIIVTIIVIRLMLIPSKTDKDKDDGEFLTSIFFLGAGVLILYEMQLIKDRHNAYEDMVQATSNIGYEQLKAENKEKKRKAIKILRMEPPTEESEADTESSTESDSDST